MIHYLVGGAITILKNMTSSVGMMKFPIYGNIKHVPNHQPVMVDSPESHGWWPEGNFFSDPLRPSLHFLLRVSAHFGRTASPSTRPVDQTWGTSKTHHITDMTLAWSLAVTWSGTHTLKPISSQLCKLEKVHGLLILSQCSAISTLILWGPHTKSRTSHSHQPSKKNSPRVPTRPCRRNAAGTWNLWDQDWKRNNTGQLMGMGATHPVYDDWWISTHVACGSTSHFLKFVNDYSM